MTKDEIIKELRYLHGVIGVYDDHKLATVVHNAERAIKAALDMLEQPYYWGQQNGQWMPIETAPRDGTEIIVWNQTDLHDYCGVWIGKFMDGHWWLKHFGWCGAHRATHWMPLPKPPKESAE